MFSTLWNSTSLKRSVVWRDSRRREGKEDAGSVYPANGHNADNNLRSPSQVPSGTILADLPTASSDDYLPKDTTPDSPVRTPKARRPQTPRSESAIEDGRRYLSAYRQYKQNETSEDSMSAPDKSCMTRDSNGDGIESLSVPLGLVDAFSDGVERYQSCAPGLARSLEAALTASMERHARDGVHVDGLQKDVDDAELVVAADTPAAFSPHAAGKSYGQPIPEVLRQAARESEADFLCSVVPELEGESGQNEQLNDYGTITDPEQRGSLPSVVGEVEGETRQRSLAKRAAENGSADSNSSADTTAVARWESLERLQQQSLGLGNAAEHKLGRALEVCRNLGSSKDLPLAGGTLGREQAALLDALRSNLHGLEEIVSKKRLIDTTVRQETCALGGPVVISSLLDPAADSERGTAASTDPDRGRDADGAVGEVGRRESVTVSSPSSVGEGMGWVSGPQLKAFEDEIRSRYSLEIAALESERRKLKGKVDMFQRQIQFLEQESASGSMNGSRLATGAGDGDEENGFGSPVGKTRVIADLFDARLGDDDRQLQASLKAEVNTLRERVEEKDGLIDALRQALRTVAATEATENRESVTTHSRNALDPRVRETRPDSATQVVPTVGDTRHIERTRLPQSDRRLSGRSRMSRLLDAKGLQSSAGPEVAMAAVAIPSTTVSEDSLLHKSPSEDLNDVGADVSEDEGPRERPDAELVAPSATNPPAVPSPEDSPVSPVSDVIEEKMSGVSNGAGTAAVLPSTSVVSERERSNSKDDGWGRDGIVSRASMIPGAALRSVWNSARNVGSTVGRRSGPRRGANAPRHRTESSHAVLIL